MGSICGDKRHLSRPVNLKLWKLLLAFRGIKSIKSWQSSQKRHYSHVLLYLAEKPKSDFTPIEWYGTEYGHIPYMAVNLELALVAGRGRRSVAVNFLFIMTVRLHTSTFLQLGSLREGVVNMHEAMQIGHA